MRFHEDTIFKIEGQKYGQELIEIINIKGRILISEGKREEGRQREGKREEGRQRKGKRKEGRRRERRRKERGRKERRRKERGRE